MVKTLSKSVALISTYLVARLYSSTLLDESYRPTGPVLVVSKFYPGT